MSIAYGKKDELSDKVKSNFGPLIQEGGRNRLNVAITRAKKKMIVVKSLYSSDIKDSVNENLMVFKNFLTYLDSKNSKESSKQSQIKTEYIDSKFKKDIANHFMSLVANYELNVVIDYDVGNKKIDVAIVNAKTDYVVIGIILEK